VEKKSGPNPTDRAKSGTKRSLLTDGRGVPLAVVLAGANQNDFKLVGETLKALVVSRPEASEENPQGMCLDKGYDYPEVYELLEREGYTPHIRPVGECSLTAERDPEHRPRRWVVERTHSWMNRFRAILIRWQKGEDSFLGLVQLACALITLKQAGLLG
jgi:putative transposase